MGFSSRTLVMALVLTLTAILSSSAFFSRAYAQSNNPSQDVLQKKVSRLQAKAIKNKGVIELDTNSFEEVLSKPRNYSMAVLFTATSPEYQCVPCLNFDPEYRLVAAGWTKLADKSQLFFGSLDFKVGQPIFQKFGMNSAPAVLFFPSDKAANQAPERYDFARSGFIAEPFAKWVNAKAATDIRIKRPIDLVALAVKVLSGFAFIGVGYLLYKKATKVSGSKYLWSAISLFTIFIMISGHMWNQIRNPPYTIPGRGGRSGFIAQGFQNQFGLESQVIAVLYAALTGCVIALIGVVPRIETPALQRAAVWVSMGLFIFLFSLLIQIFRVKNPAYPFTLLFK